MFIQYPYSVIMEQTKFVLTEIFRFLIIYPEEVKKKNCKMILKMFQIYAQKCARKKMLILIKCFRK